MRSDTISTLAFLASSLLVKDVVAGRYDVRKRENYIIRVEEEVRVTRLADGSYATGAPSPYTTVTVPAASIVAAPSSVASVSSAAPVVEVPASSATSAVVTAAEFVQKHRFKSTSKAAPVPTTSSAAPVVVPTPSTTPVAAPTTLATVQSSSTSAAAPASTSSSSTTSGSKRGVAFNDASLVPAFSGKASWCYNWGYAQDSTPGFEYVPMLWGDKEKFYENWPAAADAFVAAGTTHFLSFNEPDLSTQAGMDVTKAVADYKTYMQPYAAKGIKLGSPAVTNGAGTSPLMGLDYLKSFVSSCSGCTIDFVPVHWYNGDALESSIQYFKKHVSDAYTAGGSKPVWITEFQYLGGDEAGFLAEIVPWLESNDQVERYSYFMASNGHLISGTSLSDIGKAYVA
ncbi:glycosyl hydrolase catalytic core-domain-containing protein [Amylocarpus encephaloides]|uniref:Glycosyl hydrolase catalytic core-domain-containing protein n=1 Tax=Amylocarpus encephaloides TaxID=45428 RepID=A0A9P8BZQ9_9HELO|nr:glycosyl hydrolase catalytic core-domain-containing protein [Amylocarpus encephaloides]